MQKLTDNELMQEIKSGDLDKLGVLYERYKDRLFGFFFKMNNDTQLSEDLIHILFIRILKYANNYEDRGLFTTWIFKLARNIYYDHLKKNKKRLNPIQLDIVKNQVISTDTTDEVMEKNHDILQLKEALFRLSPKKREILVLRRYNEISYSEIAKVVGCSESAAKVRAYRAIKELRQIFIKLEK